MWYLVLKIHFPYFLTFATIRLLYLERIKIIKKTQKSLLSELNRMSLKRPNLHINDMHHANYLFLFFCKNSGILIPPVSEVVLLTCPKF